MRLAVFDVSLEAFAQWLGMPDDVDIIGVEVAGPTQHSVIRVLAHDPALPDSDVPHQCDPTVRHEVIRWSWNVGGPDD